MLKNIFMLIVITTLLVLLLIRNIIYPFSKINNNLLLGDIKTYPAGDVNGDCNVSSLDIVLVKKHMLKLSTLTGEKFIRADVKKDSLVNAADYVLIKKTIINGGVKNGCRSESLTYTVTYQDLNKKETKKEGEALGSLPTTSKSGYKFLGWFTDSTGGTQVSASTKVTGNMILYAHWEKNGYIITDDSKYSKYTTIASCSSSTMKYRIINYNNNDIVLVWVNNPITQLNSALASSDATKSASAETILSNEIKNYGYTEKCMVATNASFFDMGTGNIKASVILSKGAIVRDIAGGAKGVIGVNGNGNLTEYGATSKANDLKNHYGVRSTFRISGPTHADGSNDIGNRTQICQYDKNNFAIFSGGGKVRDSGELLKNLVGCSIAYNLDGGGSRKLYYKTQTSSTMTKRFGGGRPVPDMLYFAE